MRMRPRNQWKCALASWNVQYRPYCILFALLQRQTSDRRRELINKPSSGSPTMPDLVSPPSVRTFLGLCYPAVEPLQVQHTNIDSSEANRREPESIILRDRSQGDTQTSGPTGSVRWGRIEVRNCVLELRILSALMLLHPQSPDSAHGGTSGKSVRIFLGNLYPGG